MKKIFGLIALLCFTASPSFAVGKLQNEDFKSAAQIKASVLTTTGTLSSGVACISSPASVTRLAAGQFVYDTTTPSNIPSGTTIVGLPGSCSSGQIQMSANAAGSGSGDTLTFGGQLSQLLNDTKIYVTANSVNNTLFSWITALGPVGGGLSLAYNVIVGSAAQVSAGVAQYSSLVTYAASAANGDRVLVLPTYTGAENFTIANKITVVGLGESSQITGNLTLASGSSYCLIKGLRVSGSITVNSGVAGVIIGDTFQAASQSLVDNGTGDYITVMGE